MKPRGISPDSCMAAAFRIKMKTCRFTASPPRRECSARCSTGSPRATICREPSPGATGPGARGIVVRALRTGRGTVSMSGRFKPRRARRGHDRVKACSLCGVRARRGRGSGAPVLASPVAPEPAGRERVTRSSAILPRTPVSSSGRIRVRLPRRRRPPIRCRRRSRRAG